MGRGRKASHHSPLALLACYFSLLSNEPWERLWWRRQVYFTLLFLTLLATLMVHSKRDLLYRNTERHVKKSSKRWKRIKIQGLSACQNSSIYKSKPVKHFQLFFAEYGKFELFTRDLKIFALASFRCSRESKPLSFGKAFGRGGKFISPCYFWHFLRRRWFTVNVICFTGIPEDMSKRVVKAEKG